MGGEDKDSTSTKLSGRNHKTDEVFDVAILKLLKDFTSAELLSHSAEGNTLNGAGSCPDSPCEDVVMSLKHLHLRKPTLTRPLRLKRSLLKKRHSANTLNLAIAASSYQKPVVWPARLSSKCKQDGPSMLCPSKLRLDNPSNCNSLPSSTSEEAAVVSAVVANDATAATKDNSSSHDIVQFGNVSSLDFSRLSFSYLREQAMQKEKADCSASQLENEAAATAVSKRHSSSSIPPAKFARTVAVDDESISCRTAFTDYRSCPTHPTKLLDTSNYRCHATLSRDIARSECLSGNPYSRGNSYSRFHLSAADPSSDPLPQGLNASASPLSSSLQSSACSSPPSGTRNSPDTFGLSLSCSHELRMEEMNVNELASYFEDLVHIPKKMSSMAEMMYA